MKPITENDIETIAIEIFQSTGWSYVHGLSIAPKAEHAERETYEQIILIERLRKAVRILNPTIPITTQEQAIQQVIKLHNTDDMVADNEIFHKLLIEKVKIPYQQDGFERSYEVALVDFDTVQNNEFLCVNQYRIKGDKGEKIPDIILFVNGLPLVVIELKNAIDEKATLEKAYYQLQTYKNTIPRLFTYNAICVLSDGFDCKAGSISSGLNRFMTWKKIDDKKKESSSGLQLETLIQGMLCPETFLDIVRNFIVFERTTEKDFKTGIMATKAIKKIAAYHQYYAVNKAVQSSIMASGSKGDKKGGVVWHTQGSGKSLSMVFYSGKLITAPLMQNPTIIVLTDRNDLDDQLFDTFVNSQSLLRQIPVQAHSREHLKELLKVASGGIIFTTIQKFLPEEDKSIYDTLSERRNIVVIADEAHRTQYGFEPSIKDIVDKESKETIGKRIVYGFAKYLRDALPNATYIGFTGTPIESADVNTTQVFGQYIDIYDISQAVRDGATVTIYYESRLIKINLEEESKHLLEELEAELELSENQQTKAKYSKLEAIIGNTERIQFLAKDIIEHFEQRQKILDGKSMIVAMSRRIAANLYKEIITLKPEWHDDDINKGVIKVVMTSVSSDGPEMQYHNTTKIQRRNLADRMKDPYDSLRLVIVCDMWLTGFDAPCLNTLYIDKPMQGHNLMQAIARVNRVFKDKAGGLIVDYFGIGTNLKQALSFYADSGGRGEPAVDILQAIHLMNEKYEVVCQFFKEKSTSQEDLWKQNPQAYYPNSTEYNYKRFFDVDTKEKLAIICEAQEHILGLEDGRTRFTKEVSLLMKVFGLVMPNQRAVQLQEDIAFFQGLKARLIKLDGTSSISGKSNMEIETLIKQIMDKAFISDEVIDIFQVAGMDKPEISGLGVLSDEFLLEVQGSRYKNSALELLKKLLNDEIRVRSKQNYVKSKEFLEMLENTMKRYQNNLITTAEVIQELIHITQEVKKADKRGDELGLTQDEVAFYDALEVNDSAVKILGDHQLREIAQEITRAVKTNTTIDWTIRESARANLRRIIKRTLTRLGYPPDKEAQAVETVIKQAELMANFITNQD